MKKNKSIILRKDFVLSNSEKIFYNLFFNKIKINFLIYIFYTPILFSAYCEHTAKQLVFDLYFYNKKLIYKLYRYF